MLLDQPLAGTAELQPGAVNQQVQRTTGRGARRGRQGPSPSAQGGVVGHRQVKVEQLHQRANQPFGLPEGQVEERPQRQRRLDRHGRVARLPAAGGAWGGAPSLDGVITEPDGQAAALPQAGFIGGPIRHAILGSGEPMAVSGVVFERHRSAEMVANHGARGLPRSLCRRQTGIHAPRWPLP